MATGLSAARSNAELTSLDSKYLQLHVGDPGANGTANVASETSRQQISLGTPSGGSVTNDTAFTFSSITGSQTATHFSLWSAASAGTFEASGTLSGPAYTAGDDVEFAVGALTLTIGTAA